MPLPVVEGRAVEAMSAKVAPRSFEELRPGFKLRAHAKPKSDLVLAAFFSCVVLVFAGAVVFANSYDNDVWFFLATGECIVKNGIPYTNPFSIYPDMGFIAQQWLHCVISYGVYQLGGFVGLGIVAVVLFLALAASMAALAFKIRQSRSGAEVVMMLVAASVVACSTYASVRPHLYSMLAFVWIIYLCESYRADQRKAQLAFLPLIVVLHVNLHAAIAPFDLFIIALYCIPDVASMLHRRGRLKGVSLVCATYPRKPLVLALVACAVALFANPYGASGAFYVLLSYGAASYKGRISEMNNLVPAASFINAYCTILMFITVCVIGRMGLRRINLPLLILALVGIVGAVMLIRNRWLAGLFCFAYLAWATRASSFTVFKEGRATRPVACAILIVGVVALSARIARGAPALAEKPVDASRTPVETMRYLDSIGADKQTTKVFCFFNAGGYVEFCGYKVNVDPRPEIWNATINGTGKDHYYEYVEMALGNTSFNSYNDRYDFDVFIIEEGAGTDPYFEDSPAYVEIPGGNGYRSYAKKSWLDQYV